MIVRNFFVIFLIVKSASSVHRVEPIDFLNVESFDGLRHYPVFKLTVTAKDSKRASSSPRKLIEPPTREKSAKIIVTKATSSREVDDKVRDFQPMSRDDIRSLKKLSFHGRAPPKSSSNATTSAAPISSTRPTPSASASTQQRKYKTTQQRPTKSAPKATVAPKLKSAAATKETRKRAASSSKHDVVKVQKTSDVSFPKNIDKGFIPLLKPSPINVHSPSAPSFHTMRSYQDYLKQRQKIFFEALEKDDERKLADVRDETSTKSRDVETEIDYFTKREKELADEQRPKSTKATTKMMDQKKQQYNSKKKDKAMMDNSTKRRSSSNENDSAEEDEQQQRDESTEEEAADDSSSVEMDDESSEDGEEEESKKYENFVPFKMYAQVRHMEAENHRPKHEADEPNVKEKLSLEKKNVYYKEEGYDEKKYDHGAEKVDAEYENHSKRQRRSIETTAEAAEADTTTSTQPPMALALIKKSELPNLTGAKLFHHLDELIANSSIVLADDDYLKASGSDPSKSIIYGTRAGFVHNAKFPFYSLPDTDTLNTMSAYRYAENVKNFPDSKQSLYDFKNLRECQELDENVDPVPQDIDVKGKSTSFNDKPKRLKNLGGKINCYKNKMFGKDPFDNPLFKEEYVAASIPIPLRASRETARIAHQVNPLIAVYDDVIANIRSSFADEVKNKQQQQQQEIGDSGTADSIRDEKTTFRPNVRLYDLSAAPGVSRLPMFDINTFYPKFKARPIGLDDDDEEVAKTSKRNIRQDFEMEFIESKPKSGKFTARDAFRPSESAIVNLRPPIPANKLLEKRKRRAPIPLQITITRVYPSKSSSSSKSLSKYLQPPSLDKFRIL